MNHYILLFFIIFFSNTEAYSQDFNVKLKLVDSSSFVFNNEYLPTPISHIGSIESNMKVKETVMKIACVQYYLSFTTAVNTFKTDTLNAVFITYKDLKYGVIIDANKDNNFENDKEYLFEKSTDFYTIELPVQIDRNVEKDITLKSFILQSIKSDTTKTPGYKLVSNWFYKGDFNLDDIGVDIHLKPIYSHSPNKSPYTFNLAAGDEKTYFHNIGDTVLIADKLYKTTGNIDHIYFKDIGFIDYNIFPVTDHVTKKQLNKNDFTGKYILLDFWGSWCQPCINSIPELKKIRDEHNERLQVISLAYENNDDMSALDSLIKEYEMNWPQISFVRTANNEKLNGSEYKIQAFPTFILIDPEGKTILRTKSVDGLDSINLYLKENLSKQTQYR